MSPQVSPHLLNPSIQLGSLSEIVVDTNPNQLVSKPSNPVSLYLILQVWKQNKNNNSQNL